MTQKVEKLNLYRKVERLQDALQAESSARIRMFLEIDTLRSAVTQLTKKNKGLQQDNDAMRIMLANLHAFDPVTR